MQVSLDVSAIEAAVREHLRVKLPAGCDFGKITFQTDYDGELQGCSIEMLPLEPKELTANASSKDKK